MTPHGLVTPATAADARELVQAMRPEDRREFEQVGNRPALQTVLLGVMTSAPAFTMRTLSGDLIGIAGVVQAQPDAAAVWMAGTPRIETASTAFLRGSRDLLTEFHRHYGTLFNICDARNTVHIRWLRWLGFTFIRQIDRHGPNGVPVIEFARISNV